MPIDVGETTSELGTWRFARYHPDARDPLAATLSCAWYFDGQTVFRRERVFPRGLHGLIIQLDEPHRVPGGAHFPQVVYTGMATTAFVVEAAPQRSRVIGLEFMPAGGFAVLGAPVNETIDESIDLRDLIGSDADVLLERCSTARSPEEVLRAAVRWCAVRVCRAPPCDVAVAAALRKIEDTRGTIRVRELAEHVSRSERAFERVFRDRVGVVAKRYARIVRFAYAHELLVAGADGALGDVAARAGYYDQAHFNADFREHAGLSPTQYLTSPRYSESRSIVEPGQTDFSKTETPEFAILSA